MMRMYEDGQFLAETNISNVGDITTQNDIFFGTDIDLEYDYNGSISEVRMWNTLLSDQEIADYACDTLDSGHLSYSNLVGYWKLNEGSGTIVEDDSSNANHGTINNAIWYEPDTIWQYDYSKTPRVEDIAVSALAHLCVPIDTSWSLDGNSLVPDCIYNDIFCANPGYNTWVGDSIGIWHEDTNWSRGFVPKRCDHVIIPNANSVTIDGEKAGECRSITIHPSSQLNIENGTSLEVYEE